MSELWEYEGDQAEHETHHRAVWALVVLACAAVIVVCLVVLFGKGDGSKNLANLGATSHAPSSPDLATQTVASTPSTSTPASSTPVPTGTPGATGNPCPSAPACVVPGDGGAMAAVNAYRAAHHLPAVPGEVSQAAQTCALHNGSGDTCVPHYAYTALASQDGTLAIGKISQFASSWLLDPGVSTMSAGWAYVGGQYECVLLKAP